MDPVVWIAAVAKILFVLVIVLTFAPVLVWADRRQSAMIQDRIGPIRAGVPIAGQNVALWGLLHPLADALKFMWKEDFIPPGADKLLHALAPIIAVIPAVAAFAVIPFGDRIYVDHLMATLPANPEGAGIPFQVASLDIGILFVFAVAGTGVVGAALAGYCSDNKYALLGGLRAAGQMVSYEVSLGLSLVGCFMMYDTLRLDEMARWQTQHGWGVLWQPLAFVLFFAGSIAETKRIPFDVPEGESELAAGYFTEYSGMKFGMFMMGEYIEIVAHCCILTALFFGGWHVPGLDAQGIYVPFSGARVVDLSHLTVSILNTLHFMAKVVILCWLHLMIRWSLPRFRYDQIMKLCWQYILPLSLLNILYSGILVLVVQKWMGWF
jgi:NADH-quinone oxidoreductase subunit H